MYTWFKSLLFLYEINLFVFHFDKFLIVKTIKNTYTVGLPPTIPVSPGAKKIQF